MREHGVLRRVLLVYEAALRKENPPAQVIKGGAGIIRKFIESYHEKLEEEHVFPRVQKQLPELVKTLVAQHAKGRQLTDAILANASGQAVRQFIDLYRPHAAREDTVLFPAFRNAVPQREYMKLGDKFESLETKLVGHGGFEKAVDEVAQLEKELGIYEL